MLENLLGMGAKSGEVVCAELFGASVVVRWESMGVWVLA